MWELICARMNAWLFIMLQCWIFGVKVSQWNHLKMKPHFTGFARHIHNVLDNSSRGLYGCWVSAMFIKISNLWKLFHWLFKAAVIWRILAYIMVILTRKQCEIRNKYNQLRNLHFRNFYNACVRIFLINICWRPFNILHIYNYRFKKNEGPS